MKELHPREGVVYRVQHTEDGRGPWRPGGFTNAWSEGKPLPPPWFEEFPSVVLDHGHYYGSGVKTIDGLLLWFTTKELGKLFNLGYQVVELHGCEIVAESDSQVLFRRLLPHRDEAVPVELGVMA